MAQTSTLPPTLVAVLAWQVVETNSLGHRAVIAAFDLSADARDFAVAKTNSRSTASYEVREDPAWVETRVLRRPTTVHEPHEDLEPLAVPA